MGELRPVYCKYCRQTFISDDMEQCSACGKKGGMMDPADEAAYLAEMAAQKQAEITERAGGNPLRFYPLFRLLTAGVVCILLGFAMVLIPAFRDDPQTISGNDIGRGICASVVGLVLAALPLLLSWRRQ